MGTVQQGGGRRAHLPWDGERLVCSRSSGAKAVCKWATRASISQLSPCLSAPSGPAFGEMHKGRRRKHGAGLEVVMGDTMLRNTGPQHLGAGRVSLLYRWENEAQMGNGLASVTVQVSDND